MYSNLGRKSTNKEGTAQQQKPFLATAPDG